jgi:hypothetical protein
MFPPRQQAGNMRRLWMEFCATHQLDPSFHNCTDPVPYLQVFGKKCRHGKVSPGNHTVRASTVLMPYVWWDKDASNWGPGTSAMTESRPSSTSESNDNCERLRSMIQPQQESNQSHFSWYNTSSRLHTTIRLPTGDRRQKLRDLVKVASAKSTGPFCQRTRLVSQEILAYMDSNARTNRQTRLMRRNLPLGHTRFQATGDLICIAFCLP